MLFDLGAELETPEQMTSWRGDGILAEDQNAANDDGGARQPLLVAHGTGGRTYGVRNRGGWTRNGNPPQLPSQSANLTTTFRLKYYVLI